MTVTAYAAGDRNELKGLLSPEVFASFAAAIAEREKRGERMEFSFVGVDRADIIEASLTEGTAQVTVRFVSKLISATFDKSGALIDGEPSKVTEVTDIWTFAREVRSRDPNWRLVATESDA
ncbi:Tim44-like domain protein [Methylobrevis pamukkalensis]|uniref:Large ribosomal subunit protein mL45 n=1 Tax=Methylobrevis pamukkalensis TaxID=1439726 RepID=A0A1E3H1T9_9HYPH|nr:Tim44-like domain protein [Methylobrevis pamukkalensis]